MTDREALTRYVESRDAEAFAALVRAYGGLVYGVCRRRLGNDADAEDATQETFLKLARRAAQVRSHLGAWLVRCAVTTSIDHRRHAARRRIREGRVVPAEPAADHPAEAAELQREVDRAIDALEGPDRELVIEHYLLGRPQNAIAAERGVSPSAVNRQLQRAVRRLRETLAERGVRPAALGGLAGLLADAAAAWPSAELAASLTKLGLAGVGAAAAGSGGIGLGVAVKWSAAALLALAAAGGGAWWFATGPATPPPTSVATPPVMPASAPADEPGVQRRVRELVYLLRFELYPFTYGPATAQWTAALRELVEIGPPAVPELARELAATRNDATLRALGFALRAIGDPRAAPALIEALPRTRVLASDFGLRVDDSRLAAFMRRYESGGNHRDTGTRFGFKRSVREVTTALETLTGQSFGNDHYRPINGDTPEARAEERAKNQAVADHFAAWWQQQGGALLAERGLTPLDLSPRGDDPVEVAGVARYGRRFDLGPAAVLGPERRVELAHPIGFDARSHLDFERGHVYRREEGIDAIDGPGRADRVQWWRAAGIDATVQLIGHLKAGEGGETVWEPRLIPRRLLAVPVPATHWDRLPALLAAERPLDGRPRGVDDKLRYEPRDDGVRLPATFLFHTGDGTYGILQVLSSDATPPRVVLRYRLIHRDAAAAAAFDPGPPLADPPVEGFNWSEPRRLTLAGTDSADPAAIDLDTGETRPIPEAMRHVNIRFDAGSTARYERMMAWARAQGLDVVTMRSADHESAGLRGVTSGPWAAHPDGRLGDAREFAGVPAEPAAWDELTADEAVAIAGRAPRRHETMAVNQPQTLYDRPATLLFRTDEGCVGLLRFHSGWGEDPVDFEYKLVERAGP
ncbi:MAG: sigma-70 family RNA polymerase sigma factor [Planctomycetota bacterium]